MARRRRDADAETGSITECCNSRQRHRGVDIQTFSACLACLVGSHLKGWEPVAHLICALDLVQSCHTALCKVQF